VSLLHRIAEHGGVLYDDDGFKVELIAQSDDGSRQRVCANDHVAQVVVEAGQRRRVRCGGKLLGGDGKQGGVADGQELPPELVVYFHLPLRLRLNWAELVELEVVVRVVDGRHR
jgi:hypothetical protein